MSKLLPPSRPAWPKERVAALLVEHAVAAPVVLVGLRGYYRDTMGAPGRNDLGLYDDALYLYSAHACASFNGNVDPSRDGWNAKVRKPMAILQAGLWLYRLGTHKAGRAGAHRALVQAAAVTVHRGPGKETGWFGINIHRGGTTTTSSEGCQTVPPGQWPAFLALVEGEMRRAGIQRLPYLLIEAQG